MGYNRQFFLRWIGIIVGILLIYPMIVHYLQNIIELPFLINESFHSVLQVFLAGPLLILLGLFCYKNEVVKMKLEGGIFILIGLFWIIAIIVDVLTTYP